MSDRTAPARRIWQLIEPVHAVTYFAPEPLSALADAGYRGFWMGYFAGRSAPLGAVDAPAVQAAFFNFAPERVTKALPAAWDFAPPQAALDARSAGSVAALLRSVAAVAGADAGIDRAADLLARAADAAPVEGRVLFGANRALPWPDEPWARLWHAATLLREHRGDGHVAALLAAGIGGRESHVFHAMAAGTPRKVYTVARDLADDEWASLRAALLARGLVDDAGLTADGRTLHDEIERRTDDLAATAYASLHDDEISELLTVLHPISRAVVAAGDIPLDSPMGLDLRTVDTDHEWTAGT